MSEKDRVLSALKEAMQAEVDGHNFYRMAADSTRDEMGKETFKALAKDEVEHFTFLKAQYAAYEKDGKPDSSVKVGKPSESGESPMFSDSFKSRIKEAHYEMTALSVGVQLEISAVKFYQDQAKQAADDEMKKFFTELADWEATHHRRLLKQQQELKEDYWQDGNFSPF